MARDKDFPRLPMMKFKLPMMMRALVLVAVLALGLLMNLLMVLNPPQVPSSNPARSSWI